MKELRVPQTWIELAALCLLASITFALVVVLSRLAELRKRWRRSQSHLLGWIRARHEAAVPIIEAAKRHAAEAESDAIRELVGARFDAIRDSGDFARLIVAEAAFVRRLGYLLSRASAYPKWAEDLDYLGAVEELYRIDQIVKAAKTRYNARAERLIRFMDSFPMASLARFTRRPPILSFRVDDLAIEAPTFRKIVVDAGKRPHFIKRGI